jgi:hypothetical protein
MSQLNELSRNTLKSYIKKAPIRMLGRGADMQLDMINLGKEKSETVRKTISKDIRDRVRKNANRIRGIKKAVDRLEEEQGILSEAPTRKDFQQVADLIKTHDNAAKRAELAAHHASIFSTQNKRFDASRFYKACNAEMPKAKNNIKETVALIVNEDMENARNSLIDIIMERVNEKLDEKKIQLARNIINN